MTTELNPTLRLTSARIALGITGPAIRTREHLRFQLDHALTRDAVHAQLDLATLRRALNDRNLPHLTVSSAAQDTHDRSTYLRRPDLGRTLSPSSRELLEQSPAPTPPGLAIILADGLSALALERHAIALLDELLPRLDKSWSTGTIVLATGARVALGDEIGQILRAQIALVLIGERPGLSSPDSLGAYLTWQPRVGRVDAERNCISNIRDEGLSYAEAGRRILHLLTESRRLQTTGIALKEGSPAALSLGEGYPRK